VSYSVSERLAEQINLELTQIERLLDLHAPLLDRTWTSSPGNTEVAALAAVLHSFYTGVENAFKRVCVESGSALPSGHNWHRQLLDSMTKPEPCRPAVISDSLRVLLRGYLDFRHVFRSGYTFDLQWEKMQGLVTECRATATRFAVEMRAFLCAK
jgi:hypothetical protein